MNLTTIVLYSILSCTICGNVVYLIWLACRKALAARGRLLEINSLLRLTAVAYVFPAGVLYTAYGMIGFNNGKIVTFQMTAGFLTIFRIIFKVTLMVWFVGACVYGMRLLLGRRKIETALLFGTEIDDIEKMLLDRVKEKTGYHKTVKVYKWPFSITPMVVHKRRILLPLDITDHDTLRICLTHELNHIIAGDLLWGSVCNLICLLQWFNPVIYKWREEMTLWSEISCDIRSLKNLPGCSQKKYYSTVLQFCGMNQTADNGVRLSDNVFEMKERIHYVRLFNNSKKYFKALVAVLLIAGIVLMTQTSLVSAEVIFGVDSKLLDATLQEEQIETDFVLVIGNEMEEKIEQINKERVEVVSASDYIVLTDSYLSFYVSDAETNVIHQSGTALNLNEGDVVRLVVSPEETTAVIDYGIISANIFRYVTYTEGSATDHEFSIDTAGTYYVAIRNKSAYSLDVSVAVWVK